MKKNLTLGVSEEQKKDIVSEFSSSSVLHKRLQEMMKEKVEYAVKQNASINNYESANWAYKQADLVGYMRAMDEISSWL